MPPDCLQHTHSGHNHNLRSRLIKQIEANETQQNNEQGPTVGQCLITWSQSDLLLVPMNSVSNAHRLSATYSLVLIS